MWVKIFFNLNFIFVALPTLALAPAGCSNDMISQCLYFRKRKKKNIGEHLIHIWVMKVLNTFLNYIFLKYKTNQLENPNIYAHHISCQKMVQKKKERFILKF